jgi:hypothetical protein
MEIIMFELSSLLPYFPLISVILAGFISYLFTFRKSKKELFINHVNESLKDFCSPIYHELKSIKRLKDSSDIEIRLTNLFDSFTNRETSIYKAADLYILKKFYELEDSFFQFKVFRTEELWEKFWINLEKFYIMIENEYYDNCTTLYLDYKWMKHQSRKSFIVRFLNEAIIIFYELLKFLLVISLLGIYFVIADKIQGSKMFPDEYYMLPIISLALILMTFIILYPFTSNYAVLRKMQNKKGFVEIMLRKKFPKIYAKWDNWLNKSHDKKWDIPPINIVCDDHAKGKNEAAPTEESGDII